MADRTQSYAANQANQRDEIATIVATYDHQAAKYQDILPSSVNPAEFRNAFLVSVQMNPRLLEADRQSLWLALQRCAGDGLKPDGREAALVIFGDDAEDEDGNPIASQANGKKKVVYMPMVFGLVKLVRNTGNVANIRAKLIYKGERVVICDEDGKESYKHVREIDAASTIDDNPANIIGAYAVINYKDGFWEMEPMTRKQIDRVKAVSRAKKGPWLPWYDEMAKKTVLRRLIKRLEKSSELQRIDAAIEHDETLATTIEGDRPTEIVGEIEHAQEIRQEFSAQKQAEPVRTAQQRQPDDTQKVSENPIQSQTTEPKPDPSAGNSRQAETSTPASSVGESQSRVAPNVPSVGSGQPATIDTVEIWACEDSGEPLDRPEPFTAIEFANWFASALFRSKSPDALMEHNADAIGEAGSDDKARTVITDAIARHRKGVAEPSEKTATPTQTTAADPAQDKPKRRAIPIQKTSKGALHWPNYATIARTEIGKLESFADANDWEAVNSPTYLKSGAARISIDNALATRRRELEGFAEPPPLNKTTPGDAPLDDSEVLNIITIQMSTMTTEDEITEWSKGEQVKAMMFGLRDRSREKFDHALAIIDARRLALAPPL